MSDPGDHDSPGDPGDPNDHDDAEPFERVWTVRFSDCDPFGIAHYPRIVDALHETSDMFMEEIGFPFWEISQEHGYGLPLVQMDFEFERMMDAGDEVRVTLTPELGASGVRFDYEGRVDGEVTFSGYEQRVCATRDGSRPLPDDLREAMEPYTRD